MLHSFFIRPRFMAFHRKKERERETQHPRREIYIAAREICRCIKYILHTRGKKIYTPGFIAAEMLKERERLQVKKNALAFFSSSLESLQAMDKQTWSHHIPQSLSYQVSAGDMCGNLLARFTQNCTDFHRLRRRIHHRLGTIGGMRSHFSWLRVGTLASHRV